MKAKAVHEKDRGGKKGNLDRDAEKFEAHLMLSSCALDISSVVGGST